MWKPLGAAGVLVATAALWAACAGETFVDVELEGDACSSQEECGTNLGLECIDGGCRCPVPGETLCPLRDTEPVDRRCRPANECAGAQDAGIATDAAPESECDTSDDCPPPKDPQCGSATCEQGVCGLELVDEIRSQRKGDCRFKRCSPLGALYDDLAMADTYNDGNECTINACEEATKTPFNPPVARGPSPESSGFCDGHGHWVGCLDDEDCRNPELVCSKSGVCVLLHCEDGILSSMQGETALDCGGPCDPCPSGLACNDSSDCKEGVCANRRCSEATCRDHVQNGAESDADCGGPSCDPCETEEKCLMPSDCASGVCWGGKCEAASCDDGVKNADEIGIDCGYPCPPCPTETKRNE